MKMENVPPQEIHQRLANSQAGLATLGLDGALLFQNVDLFYFSGTIQSSILFIPTEGDPILMVQKGFQRVKEECPLKNIVAVNGKSHLSNTLLDFGIRGIERLGLELDVLPAHLYLWLEETFPQCRFVDVSVSYSQAAHDQVTPMKQNRSERPLPFSIKGSWRFRDSSKRE